MDDLEAIKRKRLEELQRRMFEQQIQNQQEEIQLRQQIEALENLAKQYMEKEAISRYGNIKIAHPEKAVHVIAVIAEAVRNGSIKEKITDEQLKEFLRELQEPKKEFKIRR